MKKIMYSLFFLSCLFLLSSTSFPQLNFEENFDYPAGDTLTTHGWVNHSGTGLFIVLVPGSLSYPGYASSNIGNSVDLAGGSGSREDVTAAFNVDSVSNVYCSFLVSVDSIGATPDYFFHFREDPVAAILRGRVFIRDNGAGGFNFGMSKGSTSLIDWDTTARTLTETYLVVLKYEYVVGTGNDLIHLFVNPSLTAGEPATPNATVPDTSGSDIIANAVSLRQGSQVYNVKLDGIRVANSWADVLNFMTIAQAIEDLNTDYVPDRVGDTVTVEGVVFSPNFQTTNNSFYIHDGTAGTDIFMFGPPVYTWAMGDMVKVTGVVTQFNGMTEIVVADTTGWVFKSAGNPTPAPIVITLAQYKANPELYEGGLVGFVSLTKVSGTWPASGSANLSFSDGVDTVVFRVDSDTDIDGQTEPTWPRDVIGIGSQFDNSAPYDGGYQIFPRSYATDFLPAGSIPVELVLFSANVVSGSVVLSWKTATETNNRGYDVQRSLDGQSFVDIGFVNGSGTSTEPKSYSFIDSDLGTAQKLYYRLRQIDYNGATVYTSIINVDVTKPVSFNLSQNYPNPFNPSTTINFSISVDAKVKVRIYDILGKEVFQVVNDNLKAGNHLYPVSFKNVSSGVYLYSIEATGVDGKTFRGSKKMTLLK